MRRRKTTSKYSEAAKRKNLADMLVRCHAQSLRVRHIHEYSVGQQTVFVWREVLHQLGVDSERTPYMQMYDPYERAHYITYAEEMIVMATKKEFTT